MSDKVEALQSRIRDLCGLVRKVHAAKGRHHTQLAMCDLFDAVGLENVRPVSPAKRYTNADCAKSEAHWTDVVSTGGMDPRNAPVGINGLTEAETSASFTGLVVAAQPISTGPAEIATGVPHGLMALVGKQECGATDPMYQDAIAIVRKYKRGSISLVQRHLRIGYNRAAFMLEAMEKAGVITPWGPNGTGRDVVPEVERKRPDDTEGGDL